MEAFCRVNFSFGRQCFLCPRSPPAAEMPPSPGRALLAPSLIPTRHRRRRHRYDPVSSTEKFFNDIPDDMLRYERNSKVPLAIRDAVRLGRNSNRPFLSCTSSMYDSTTSTTSRLLSCCLFLFFSIKSSNSWRGARADQNVFKCLGVRCSRCR